MLFSHVQSYARKLSQGSLYVFANSVLTHIIPQVDVQSESSEHAYISGCSGIAIGSLRIRYDADARAIRIIIVSIIVLFFMFCLGCLL